MKRWTGKIKQPENIQELKGHVLKKFKQKD